MRTGRRLVTMLMTLALMGPHAPGRAQPRTLPPASAPPRAATSTGGVILPRAALQPSRPGRRLSVDEAVALALEQNLDLRIERINPLIQDTLVAEARSAYAPNLSTTLTGHERDDPAGDIFAGADVVTRRNLQDSVDIEQQVPWKGGRYSARWNGERSSSNSVFLQYNPSLQSGLSLNYTQPLVRDFDIDGLRWQIAISRANRDLPTSTSVAPSSRPGAPSATPTGSSCSPGRSSRSSASRSPSRRSRCATTAPGSRSARWPRSTSSRRRTRSRGTSRR